MSIFLRTPSILHLPIFTHPLKLKPPTNPLSLSSHHQTHNFLCFSNNKNNNPQKPNKISDAELASDLSAEIYKLNTQLEERENAMKTSKQLLFSDLCNYLNLNPKEVKNQWKNMSSDEKMGLIKGFISDWGLNFHPLSPKSVRDLVEEFVVKDSEERESSDLCDINDDLSSNSDVFFPSLKKLLMGFSPNN